MREKFYFENISKNCDTIGLFLLFSVILVISHVYYKGVEYCHLIGISLKITYTYELLKKTLLGGGGGGWVIEKGFLFLLIIEYPSILIRNF